MTRGMLVLDVWGFDALGTRRRIGVGATVDVLGQSSAGITVRKGEIAAPIDPSAIMFLA